MQTVSEFQVANKLISHPDTAEETPVAQGDRRCGRPRAAPHAESSGRRLGEAGMNMRKKQARLIQASSPFNPICHALSRSLGMGVL